MVTIALNAAGVCTLGNSAGTFSSGGNASSLASDDRRETCDLLVPLDVPNVAAQIASKATWWISDDAGKGWFPTNLIFKC